MPVLYTNPAWATTIEGKFGGNLLSRQQSLDLPLKLSSLSAAVSVDYIELIKRGRNIGDLYNSGGTPTAPVITPVTAAADNADKSVTVSERYYNKLGLRVSLANSKSRLPGCASGVGTAAITGPCGVRLDGASTKPAANAPWAEADADGSHGYQPLAMADGYKATRLNGERFRTSAGEVWIKVELVSKNVTTSAVITQDVTEDILSLGVTEPAPIISGKFGIYDPAYPNYYKCANGNNFYPSSICTDLSIPVPYIDSRSIIKLQRFVMPGENFVGTDATSKAYMTNFAGWDPGYTSHNIVYAEDCIIATNVCTYPNRTSTAEAAHKKLAVVNILDTLKNKKIVPFPIEMFDAREGIYNTDIIFNTVYPNGRVPWAGVMSMVDIDVRNMRSFLNGSFNTNMPINTDYYSKQAPNKVLINTAVPQDRGWVVYISDRRGDYDFDGEYDMEDIYGNNDGILQTGEDVNDNTKLDTNYNDEAAKYIANGLFALPVPSPSPSPSVNLFPSPIGSSFVLPSYAASVDHPFYRRGVRLINGTVVQGNYDFANSDNTRGFTVASENGVYVQGNYNATGIASVGTPTKSEEYLPQGRVVVGGVTKVAGTIDGYNHIPASIAADVITILSNYDPATKKGWNDAESFFSPFAASTFKASETFTRFAMLAGDARSSFSFLQTPNQGGTTEPRLGGGVHNFKRFLEDWGGVPGVRMNYCGSLINLYNARNNNGTYKPGNVYGAPTRNWVFDSSFLSPTRLPPGTPYFQYIQTTGFQRTNN